MNKFKLKKVRFYSLEYVTVQNKDDCYSIGMVIYNVILSHQKDNMIKLKTIIKILKKELHTEDVYFDYMFSNKKSMSIIFAINNDEWYVTMGFKEITIGDTI